MSTSAAAALKNVPLFAGLDDRELEKIGSTMKERRYSAGQTLIEEGAGGVGFFVIEEGEADVTIGGEQKRTPGPGDYFGEIALLADTKRTATITARTDMVCHGMVAWEFRPLVESEPAIGWKLLTAMAEKLG